MKILVVSCSPWRSDNNIGNSYTNIFKGIPNIKIAHICCGSGLPNTDFVKKHYHISEKTILKNLFNKNEKSGVLVKNKSNKNNLVPIGKKSGLFDFARTHRFQVFFWLRDIIWSFKNWICDDLKTFIDDFNPDIIFAPFLDTAYLNDMLIFIKRYTGKKLILYAWDDVYSLKRFSLSPFFWINCFFQRKKLRKVAELSSLMYTISEKQKIEYEKYFGIECKILRKGFNFGDSYISGTLNKPIRLVYTGNISSGRWKTLSKIGNALREINSSGIKAQLYIYTLSPMNYKMKKSLNIKDSVIMMGGVKAEEISCIHKSADILVHVESFKYKESMGVRLSFSTKIVNYFESGKCIFAVGSADVASIEYLIKNDAAIVATSLKDIKPTIERIVANYELIDEYSKKAFECGRKNHQIEKVQKGLYEDFERLINCRDVLKHEGSSDK